MVRERQMRTPAQREGSGQPAKASAKCRSGALRAPGLSSRDTSNWLPSSAPGAEGFNTCNGNTTLVEPWTRDI